MIIWIKKISIFVIFLLTIFSLASCKASSKITIIGNDTCYIGDSIQLEAKYEDLEGEVSWEVDDEEIAKIDNKGMLKGLKEGKVKVTATVGSEKSEISIKVIKKVIEREPLFIGTNLISEEVVVHEKVEFALVEKNPGYIRENYNPFDYSKLKIYAVFTSPDHEKDIVALGFWYRDYKIILDTNLATGRVKSGEPDGMEFVNFIGDYEYRLRFQPSSSGKWTYKIYVEYDGGDITEELDGSIEVSDSSKEYKGLIKVDKSNNRTFMYEDGSTFMPIGENMGWWADNSRKTYDYYVWFSNANKNNMNIARIWMAPWGFCLHWGDSMYDYTDRLNYAARLDRVIEYADEYNMYIMLALLNHGQFSTVADSTWNQNPYNKANGGILENPQSFFTSKVAKDVYKNELLYIIGRYGYSDNIMCWELFNEVDWTDNADLNAVNIKMWHKEMAEFIKNNDSYGHMVSTSYKTEQGSSFTLDVIDFANPHSYGYAGKNICDTLPTVLDRLYRQYNKPILHSEIGIDWQNGYNNYKLDPKGISLRQASWAGMMGGGAGGAMNWWWDSYVHPYDLYYQFKGAGSYAKLLDLTGSDYTQLRTLKGVEKSSGVGLLGYRFDNRIYGYLYDTSWSYLKETGELNNINVSIPFTNGTYTLTFYSATTGVAFNNSELKVTNGIATFTVPKFTSDVAFIIK